MHKRFDFAFDLIRIWLTNHLNRQVGDLVFSPTGLAKSGLLVRHLAMPDMVGETPDKIDVSHFGLN